MGLYDRYRRSFPLLSEVVPDLKAKADLEDPPGCLFPICKGEGGAVRISQHVVDASRYSKTIVEVADNPLIRSAEIRARFEGDRRMKLLVPGRPGLVFEAEALDSRQDFEIWKSPSTLMEVEAPAEEVGSDLEPGIFDRTVLVAHFQTCILVDDLIRSISQARRIEKDSDSVGDMGFVEGRLLVNARALTIHPP